MRFILALAFLCASLGTALADAPATVSFCHATADSTCSQSLLTRTLDPGNYAVYHFADGGTVEAWGIRTPAGNRVEFRSVWLTAAPPQHAHLTGTIGNTEALVAFADGDIRAYRLGERFNNMLITKITSYGIALGDTDVRVGQVLPEPPPIPHSVVWVAPVGARLTRVLSPGVGVTIE